MTLNNELMNVGFSGRPGWVQGSGNCSAARADNRTTVQHLTDSRGTSSRGARTLRNVKRRRRPFTGMLLAAVLMVAGALPATAGVTATEIRLEGDRQETVFSLTLTGGVTAKVFTLANPYRVIVDMPDVTFQLPVSAGQTGKGLVQAYRYGLFAPGKSRIVMDTVLPVSIAQAEMINVPVGKGVQLNLLLRATNAATFGTGTGAEQIRSKTPARADDDQAAALPQNPQPVIVIDPGHGGVDPGALGRNRLYEKMVVLDVAKQLHQELMKRGGYRSYLTRVDDVFVSLDDRLAFSEEKKADLFISLHADALADADSAEFVRGATVYTLSERASDAIARRMAEKENNADAVAGLTPEGPEKTQQVRSILADLLKRETANFSSHFSTTLIGEMRERMKVARSPQRSAAFKVLKQTRTPSVLVELGYLSNSEDHKLMQSQEWREAVAVSIANAIDAFFAGRR